MNPEESLYNTVTLRNIDSAPFEAVYNNRSYFVLAPNEVKNMPKFLADHILKHMIDQIINRRDPEGKRLGDVVLRKKLASAIVVNEEPLLRPRVRTEAEQLAEDIDKLNRPSELDAILGKRKRADQDVLPEDLPSVTTRAAKSADDEMLPELDLTEIDNPTPPAATTPSVADELMPGSAEAPGALPVTTAPAPVTPSPVDDILPVETTEVTRQTLYDYAKNVMKMDLADKKTMAALENMPLNQLKEELQYNPL